MHRRSVAVAFAGAVAVAAALLSPVQPAQASQTGISGDASPIWQPDGIVRGVAVAKGTVWAVGDFTRIRPPGAAPGVSERARFHLAAFDSSTGNPLGTAFGSNNRISAAETAPDGARVYVGGTFTSFGGAAHGGVAAIDATTRTVVHAFAPQTNGWVRAVAATPSVVYLGGDFTTVNGVARRNLAAVDASSGALLPWNPGADGTVHSLAVGGSTVYVGGDYDTLAGRAVHALGAVDATSGALVSFPASSTIPPREPKCVAKVKDIEISAGVVYIASEGTGGGCFDGTVAARQSDGSVIWKNVCRGATQTVQPFSGVLVRGSHTHDCNDTAATDPDAFPELSRLRLPRRYLSAQSLATGNLTSWMPEIGVVDPKNQLGPYGMDTDGTQLFVGGDFSSVNGVPQTYLTRFRLGDSPTPAPSAPVVTPTGPNQLTVYVRPPVDRDDTDLVVDLFRGSGTTPIASLPTHSLFWRQVAVSFTVTAAAGTSPQFRASARPAKGGTGSGKSSLSAPVAAVAALPTYATTVLADSPSLYWRLGDRSGSVLAGDTSPGRTGGVISGNPRRNEAGAVAGDTAYTLGVTVNDEVATPVAAAAPATFTAELWFRTTSTTGGQLIGFGDKPKGPSTVRDRQVYLTDTGQLRFATVVGGTLVNLASPGTYRDGGWHHVAVSQSSAGARLYVDGAQVAASGAGSAQVYSGYWRVGNDTLNGLTGNPTTDWVTAGVDEVAVYPTALSLTRIQAHVAAKRAG